MPSGRKPLSTASHELTGAHDKNPGRRNAREPRPPSGTPDIPAHLKGVAAKKWRQLASLLYGMRAVTVADSDMLELYCDTYAAYRLARKNVAETGQVIVVRKEAGGLVEVKRNPHSTEYHRYADRLAKLLAEMGLTPSSRTRIAVTAQEDDDPFMEWLSANREALN